VPHYTDYSCHDCGATFSQSEAQAGKLMRKTVQFQTFGNKPRTVRSRTIKFVCINCITVDPEYNIESFRAPGQLSQGLERVRVAELLLEP
jgi:hypothetical protein